MRYDLKLLLGCVMFFLRLAHVVNWGVRRGQPPSPLCCTDCIAGGGAVTGGLRGAGNPTLWGPG